MLHITDEKTDKKVDKHIGCSKNIIASLIQISRGIIFWWKAN